MLHFGKRMLDAGVTTGATDENESPQSQEHQPPGATCEAVQHAVGVPLMRRVAEMHAQADAVRARPAWSQPLLPPPARTKAIHD